MTALAFDYDLPSFDSRSAQAFQPAPRPISAVVGVEDVDCNRHLWLHITLLAPLSAALWTGIGWGACHLVSLAVG